MNKFLWWLATALLLTVSCTVQEQVQLTLDSAFLTHYIEAQEALAADDFEMAKSAVSQLAGNQSGGEELAELVNKAAQAEDIKALRDAFKPLSERAAGSGLPQDVVVAYCPMIDARWLQKDGEIANPYYGEEMLTCGRIETVKE